MKLSFLTVLTALAISLTTISCSSDLANDRKEPIVICPSALNMNIIDAQNEFAFKYLNLIQPDGDGNSIVSPLSLTMALAMTANGAEGETLDEIISALGLEGIPFEKVNSQNHLLLKAFPGIDPKTTLALANSLWIHEEFPVNEQFITSNAEIYEAEIRRLDMYSTDAMNAINLWVERHTNGMIKNFLSSPPNKIMSIMNALYFKGEWSDKFPKSETKKRVFHNADGSRPNVDTMHDDHHICRVFNDEDATIISLPYGNGAYRMTIILPDNGITTEDYAKTLSTEKWQDWQQLLSHETTAEVTMPLFDIDTENYPKEMMKTLGMQKAFTAEAEFSGISPAAPHISDIRQRVHIIVDEKGTEAAAVTDIDFVTALPGGTHQAITVDHPFIFIISETGSSSILFIGKINNLSL